MRNLIYTLAALLALTCVGPAFATSSLTSCATTAQGYESTVDGTECVAWRFTLVEDSPGITINSNTALICFDPDTSTDGVATGQVTIRRCPSGNKPGTNPENTCGVIMDSPLTGLTGAAATQNQCIRVGPGLYWSDVGTSPATDSAVVYFQGEGGE